uniref:Uncharacterized protein n=1 Tax=Noccaea caerulescens TaxID=107243 RepID=A0A1J3IXR7_NOCCA
MAILGGNHSPEIHSLCVETRLAVQNDESVSDLKVTEKKRNRTQKRTRKRTKRSSNALKTGLDITFAEATEKVENAEKTDEDMGTKKALPIAAEKKKRKRTRGVRTRKRKRSSNASNGLKTTQEVENAEKTDEDAGTGKAVAEVNEMGDN